MSGLTPYADPRYAASLAVAGAGEVVRVTAWDGAGLLRRAVPGRPWHDVASGYPLLAFAPGWDIAAGLAELRAAGALTLVAVADPVFPPRTLQVFALARPYKRHHLVQGGPAGYAPSQHHRAELRRAARRCEVAEIPFAEALSHWDRLYGGLIARKAITGPARMLGAGHAAALAPLAPRAFAARVGDAVVAVSLWLHQGRFAWYHLAAGDAAARAASASYAVVDLAIRTLMAEGTETVILGGGQAESDAPPCGLDQFKAGFSNAQRVNLLLGAVLDPAGCAALGGALGGHYFPAYRSCRRAAA